MKISKIVRSILSLFLILDCFTPLLVHADPNSITLVAAGDVQWSPKQPKLESGGVFFDPGGKTLLEGGWQPIPRLLSSETMASLQDNNPEILQRHYRKTEEEYGFPIEKFNAHFVGFKRHDLTFSSVSKWAKHPFLKVGEVFRNADIAFVNLETPLSDKAPKVGMFRAPTALTEGLVEAGVDVVSIANNHMLDAQIWGLYDTLTSLENAGINYVGAGKNLTQARKPYIVEKQGIKIALLAYSQSENNGVSSFATPVHAGIMPLDPLVIKADIKRIKHQVDHVILSFHWDIYAHDSSQKFDLHPDAVAFAHEMIDAGADAILGHHPHIPKAVEYYKGKPILYSMAHLIFSFELPSFVDNYVARLNITKEAISSVEILPVAGRGGDLSQPFFLEGERAAKMLNHLKTLSDGRGGTLRIMGNKGILTAN